MGHVRFKVEYDIEIEKKLEKIPKNIRDRFRSAIEQRLMVALLDYGKPLTREWRDHRRLRVGDYRVIYKVYEETVVVFIVEIDHRKEIYQS